MTLNRLLTVILALLIAGVVSACGGDGDEAETPTTPRGSLGEPITATNDPSGEGVDDGDGGLTQGPPDLDDLDDLPPESGVADDAASCSGADLEPTGSNVGEIGRATLCLLNAERKARGLPPLRANSRLARAAASHTNDMAANDYFAHQSRNGASFSDRIRRAGYIRPRTTFVVGENIAWGTGKRATPREIVDSWMNSPGHRANILSRNFKEIGLGITPDAPVRGIRGGGTYNTDFGRRSKR